MTYILYHNCILSFLFYLHYLLILVFSIQQPSIQFLLSRMI
nr:MAG TPA: hypothetical protein [Bacteriophage sp.]